MSTELSTRLRHAAKTLAQWQLITTVPKLGEVCFECDSTTSPIAFKMKIGDGTLPYYLDGGTIGVDYLPYFEATDSEGNDISAVITAWVADNLDVDTPISAISISGSNITVNSIKETDGKIVAGTTSTIALEGTYNASTNKIATESTVSDAIAALDSSVSADANYVLTGVTQTDGELTDKSQVAYTTIAPIQNVEAGDLIDVTVSSNTATVSHETVTTDVTDTSSTIAEKELEVITGITTDGYGHITEVTKDVSTNLVAADIKASVKQTDNSTWNFRPTAGDITIGEDVAEISVLKGNSIVWNQLVENGDFSDGTANWVNYSGTISAANGVLTFLSNGGDARCTATLNITNGHKYLFSVDGKVTTVSNLTGFLYIYTGSWTSMQKATDTEWHHYTAIVDSSISANTDVYYRFIQDSREAGDTDEIYIRNPNVFDLTLMFGSGNEPSTVAEFEAMFPLPYYNYNPGKLISIGYPDLMLNQLVPDDYIHTTGTYPSDSLIVYEHTNITSGHKYLYRFSDSTITSINFEFGGTFTTTSGIFTASAASGSVYISGTSGNTFDTYYNLIDLTTMYGAGNEPTSVSEVLEVIGTDYLPYTEATSLDTGKNFGIESTGFNLWDEEWELGTIDVTTGEESSSTTQIRSANYISVLSSTTYCITKGITTGYISVVWYDSEKNYISWSAFANNTLSSTGVTPSGAAYAKFVLLSSYGTTYNNDICINISDTTKNGTYEPHWSSFTSLPINSLTSNNVKIFPDGLKSAGTVYDELTGFENGYFTKAVKRIGSVDLGTLNWLKSGAYNNFYTSLPTGAPESTMSIGMICSKYMISSGNDNNVDKTLFRWTSSRRIYISDSDYNDTTSFTTAMSGVMLYYELATPVEYTLDTPVPAQYPVNDLGTEQQLPVNTSNPVCAPFTGTFIYKSNFKETVLDLIDKVNNAANPVKGLNNTNQTVGKLAVYDSAGTVQSSNYSASNATIVEGASGNDIILPSVETLVTYVNSKLSSALTYKGVFIGLNNPDTSSTTFDGYIDDVIDNLSPHTLAPSTGDMYIVGTSFTVSNDEGLAYGNVQNRTYNAGDFFIWNGSSWDIVVGTTSVVDNNPTIALGGSTYTIGTVDGTSLRITTPNLDLTSPTASGTSLEFIDTVSQSDGQVSATKKTIPSASTTQEGITSYVVDIHNSTDTTKTATAKQIWTECEKRNVQFVRTGSVEDITSMTEEEFLAQYTYGIGWTQNGTDTTKVGNTMLISSMPIHNAFKACVYQIVPEDFTVSETIDGTTYSINYGARRVFKYWLDPDDWTKQETGEDSVLTGDDMTGIAIWHPRFYGRSYEGISSSTDHTTSGTWNEVRISFFKYDSNWVEIKESFTDFAKMQLVNGYARCYGNPDFTDTNPRDNEMALADVNTWIQNQTDDSALPKSLVSTNRVTAHGYALESGAHLMSYDEYKWIFCWLPVIEFGTFQVESNDYFDWQDGSSVNAVQRDSLSTTPSFGYYGLYSANYGAITSACGWNCIPAGYTNQLGTHTGWVKMRLLNSSNTYDSKIVSRWRGFEIQRNIWTNLYGVNPVQSSTSGLCDIYTAQNRALWSNNLPLTSGSSTITTDPSTTIPYSSLNSSSPKYTVNTGFEHAGEQHWNGYGYEFDLGNTAEATYKSVTSTSTIKYDYHYGYASNANPRCFVAGSGLGNGGDGGPFYFYSGSVASYTYGDVGFRCCWNADEYETVLN